MERGCLVIVAVDTMRVQSAPNHRLVSHDGADLDTIEAEGTALLITADGLAVEAQRRFRAPRQAGLAADAALVYGGHLPSG
jgi:hypothetical protein